MRVLYLCIWLCLSNLVMSETMANSLPAVYLEQHNMESFIPVAGTAGPFALEEILHLETTHLAALGAGILVGITYLEVGELAGIIIGVIGGDLFYRAVLKKEAQHDSWLPSSWFGGALILILIYL